MDLEALQEFHNLIECIHHLVMKNNLKNPNFKKILNLLYTIDYFLDKEESLTFSMKLMWYSIRRDILLWIDQVVSKNQKVYNYDPDIRTHSVCLSRCF